MAKSQKTTVADYLTQLPAEKRAVIGKVRSLIRKHLPKGYQELVGYGMLMYAIPLRRFPDTYNGQPLCYVGLAAQKNYYSLYLMCVYGDAARAREFREGFRKAGKKLDMGKSCVRFRSIEDLPLEVIGKTIASTSVAEYIAAYEKTRK